MLFGLPAGCATDGTPYAIYRHIGYRQSPCARRRGGGADGEKS